MLNRLSVRTAGDLDNTDQIMEFLTDTAGCKPLFEAWTSHPYLKAVRVLASEHPPIASTFQSYAMSPLYDSNPLRQAVAAYVALESATPNSGQEIERLSLFTDKLFTLIAKNNQCGYSNTSSFSLFLSACKLDVGRADSSLQPFAFRRTELLKLMPKIVTLCSLNDPFLPVYCANKMLPSAFCPDTLKDRIIDIAADKTEAIPKHTSVETQHLAQTIHDFTRIGASIKNIAGQDEKYTKIWKTLVDHLYFIDPFAGLSVVRSILQNKGPTHPDILKSARYIVEHYTAPVVPKLVTHTSQSEPVFN